MKVTFYGAAGTVTGSKILVQQGDTRVLLDCGLFQGLKHLRLRNWDKFPIDLTTIDGIVLSHAHLDHSGYIPRLYSQGYRSPVYCTNATRDLSKILLRDSGYLQEEDAKWANKKKFSKHHPALPLYTQQDAHASLRIFENKDYHQAFSIGELEIKLIPAGHILGASSVHIKSNGRSLLYSGDLGRSNDVIMRPPENPEPAGTVIMESTYGNKSHSGLDPVDTLAGLVEKVLSRRSILLIPAFAVGRTQALLKCFWDLFQAHPELKVPLYVNSPMATDVTMLYKEHHAFHKLEKDRCQQVCNLPQYVNSVEQSIALNERNGPSVIISASGMLTGGRVLHHMKSVAPGPDNIILLAGFQAPGTRGARLLEGHREIKIHGEQVPVNAEIANFDFLSAHADQAELIEWVDRVPGPPKNIFLVHGEPEASDNLRFLLSQKMNQTQVAVAEDRQTIEI